MKTLKLSLSLIVIAVVVFAKLGYAGSTPTADFSVSPSTVVLPGATVCFTDQSATGGFGIDMTNWDWTFDGQAPAYSATDAAFSDTCIVFNNLGTWNVCLDVTNDEPESDNICQAITVADPFNIGTENGNTLNSHCLYYLVDDGGNGNYSNNQDNSVTFCSNAGSFVRLNFYMIDLVAGDYIEIYEGTSVAGVPIETITSTSNGGSPTIYTGDGCVTVRFVTDGAGTAGGFQMQVNCDDNVLISANDGETFTGCGYQFFDSGSSSGGYSNNENYTMTFCASSATDVIQIPFDRGGFYLSSGDQFNVYDGTTTGGSLIYTASSNDNQGWSPLFSTGLTITGISQCLTVEFISDGSSTNSGWGASINCVTPPAPCNANPIAADNFDAATMICDFSQYCGTTSSFYGIDMENIAQTSVFDGSIENNSWLMFVADSTNAAFQVATDPGCSGIQIGVYAVDANENFTWLSPAAINGGFDYTNIDDGFSGTDSLYAQGLTAGETYYIMIDGHGGAVCDYTLTAGIGVQLPDPAASLDVSMCEGDAEVINVVDNNGSTNIDWQWTWDSGAGGPISADNIDLSTFTAGTYTFDVEAIDFNECVATTLADQVVVVIDPCVVLPIELTNFEVACESDHVNLTWQTVTEFNNDYFLIEKARNNFNFEVIGEVNGGGNTSSLKNYSFEDFERNTGVTYYRLRQIDFDGSEGLSDVVSTNNCVNSDFIVNRIYHDVNSDEVVIDYSAARTVTLDISISDLSGRSHCANTEIVQPNQTQIRLDASGLVNQSMYLVNVVSGQTKNMERVFISK